MPKKIGIFGFFVFIALNVLGVFASVFEVRSGRGQSATIPLREAYSRCWPLRRGAQR